MHAKVINMNILHHERLTSVSVHLWYVYAQNTVKLMFLKECSEWNVMFQLRKSNLPAEIEKKYIYINLPYQM